MKAAAVILAAGASTRFGSRKQLARIGERTMLETVIDAARQAGLVPILAVVPVDLPVPSDVVPVVNDRPGDGLSRSLRLGLAAVPPAVEAAVILLGDQPTVPPAVLQALLAAATDTQCAVVAAHADGRIGPPVLLARDAFGLVGEATGDEGLRRILEAHSELVATVEVGEHAPDVDTPADLEALGRR